KTRIDTKTSGVLNCETGLNMKQGRRNPSAETHVHIAAGAARALVIIAVVMPEPSLVAIADRQRVGIERTDDDIGVRRIGRQMRQIHVPKCARRPGATE